MYLVFADLADRDAWVPVRCEVGSTRDVVALAMRAGPRTRLLLANLTSQPIAVAVTDLPAGAAHSRVLDSGTTPGTLSGTLDARDSSMLTIEAGTLQTELAPFAVVRVDAG
jgi:hypothetical protein